MIAYNRQSLVNRDTRQEAAKALAEDIISGEEDQRIRETYPVKLYIPNIFIRIGLFLLTVLAVACGLGLSMLITEGGAGLVIVWGIICYGALELFIARQHVYRAGVDDALVWTAGTLIFTGAAFLAPEMSAIHACELALLLATWGMLRYADRLMAILAYGALISLIFHLLTTIGKFSTALIPFVFMAVSVVVYFLFTRFSARESLRHYRPGLTLLRAAALLSFYLSVNYYVVQHLDPSIREKSAPVTLGWLWWTLTGVVPVGYIAWGIRRKDAILLWMGLPLVAATVFTVRYYYHVMPAELAMILAGTILLTAAYVLIRYLRIPRNGFTSAAADEPHPLQNLPVESLVLAETFKGVPSQPIDQPGHFGGGSGGGAGAGGTY